MDLPDRDGVEEVQLLPSGSSGDDQPGALELPQMLHDPEPRHVYSGLELREREAIALEEPIEQQPTRWIGERLEHAVVIHASIDT